MSLKPVQNPINPFVFPSETNARFLLLIVAIAGTLLILADGVIGSILLTEGYLSAFVAALVITAIVFFQAQRLARRDAHKRLKTLNWQTFPPPSQGERGRSLHAMHDYIWALLNRLPGVKATQPQFVWDEVSEGCDRPTGIAFGYGSQKFICFRKGLHDAFLKARQSTQFHTVLLHELGHLENQDVNKTILSLALGKSFFPVALVLLGILNLYVIGAILEKLATQGSLQPVWDGLPTIFSINFKTIVLILLVDVILSSILRVREFYADARAREWLGQPQAFFTLFTSVSQHHQETAQAKNRIPGQQWLTAWYRRLTLKHPTHKQRVNALLDPHGLYRPSFEVALISGVLSGLVLNSSIHFLGVGLAELTPFVSTVTQSVQGWASSYVNLLLLQLALFAMGLLIGIIFVAIVVILFSLGVLPIIATAGIQVQAAAFSDQVKADSQKYTTRFRLARLAIMIGVGFVIGCLLVPVPKTFSLVGVSPLGLVQYALLWAITFGVWLWPLSVMAKRIYGLHTGSQEPRRKRQFLTRLSALALLPSFLTSSIAHIGFSVSTFDPSTIPVNGLSLILVSLMILGFLLQAGVWLVGWMLMNGYGWFNQPRCPNCNASVYEKLSPDANCVICGTSLSEWMRLPAPITLPPLPQPEPIPTTAPPL